MSNRVTCGICSIGAVAIFTAGALLRGQDAPATLPTSQPTTSAATRPTTGANATTSAATATGPALGVEVGAAATLPTSGTASTPATGPSVAAGGELPATVPATAAAGAIAVPPTTSPATVAAATSGPATLPATLAATTPASSPAVASPAGSRFPPAPGYPPAPVKNGSDRPVSLTASKPISERYSVLLKRSLFTRGRPAAPVVPTANIPGTGGTGGSSTSAPRPPSGGMAFRGVVEQAGQYTAIVEDTAAGQTMPFKVGDTVRGGKIVAITLETLSYERGGKVTQVEVGKTLENGTAAGPTTAASAYATGGSTMFGGTTPGGGSPTTLPSGPAGEVMERLRRRRMLELGITPPPAAAPTTGPATRASTNPFDGEEEEDEF